jgi:hypothetical protein
MENRNAESPAGGGLPTGKASQRNGFAEQVLLAIVWLGANNAAVPGQTLAALGVGPEFEQWLDEHYGFEHEAFALLQRAARQMSRATVGRLLVGRLTGLTLTAQTAQEMAALTRAFRTLPEWAWEEEGEGQNQKSEDEGQSPMSNGESKGVEEAGGRPPATDSGAVRTPNGAPDRQLRMSASANGCVLSEEPRMNRAARRRLERLEAERPRARG